MEVARWPIREALLAYLDKVRAETLDQYRHEVLIFSMVAPWSKNAKPPKLPEILNGRT